MNLHKYTAIKMARALASKANLNVVLEAESKPRTNGETLYLQNPVDSWDEDRWAMWWGHLYHEIGHNDPDMRDCFTLARDKKIDMSSFFGTGINLIDDNRQERHKWNEWQGRRTYLSRSHVLTMDDYLAMSPTVFGQTEDDHRNAMEAAMVWDTYHREGWMDGMYGYGDKLYAQLKPKAKGWCDELLTVSSGERQLRSRFTLDTIVTAEDEYQLWKDIIDEIFKFTSSEEEEKQAQASYKPSKGEGGKSSDEEASAKGKAKGRGSDEDEGEGSDSDEKQRVKYSDLLKHDHSDDSNGGHAPLSIEYDESDSRYEFISQPVKVVDYSKGESRGRVGSYGRDISNTVGNSGSLSATVRRILQIRSKDRYQYGKKSGKLHGSSLHRLGIKDGGGVSSRVFKQKKVNNCLDVSFTVLGDASGSMWGSKYTNMGASMVMLHDAIAPLGIPFELMAFTDTGVTEMSLFKTFTSKTNTAKLIDDLADCGERLENNADGEAILWAYHRLAAQKTKRKVLVVLSDGSPASHRSGTDTHTKMVVENIQKQGEVEIYGIGIEDDNVSRIYKDWKVINSSDELESALLNVISTKILN